MIDEEGQQNRGHDLGWFVFILSFFLIGWAVMLNLTEHYQKTRLLKLTGGAVPNELDAGTLHLSCLSMCMSLRSICLCTCLYIRLRSSPSNCLCTRLYI